MPEQMQRIFSILDAGGTMQQVMLGDDGPACARIALDNSLIFGKGFNDVHEVCMGRIKMVLYRPYNEICKACIRCIINSSAN